MVLCPNCHCEIDDSKIFLHERFCVQNIKYCKLCQEGIILDEYEEHCQNHKNLSNEKIKSNESKESRDSLTLQRVESSKIGCQYCGYLCGYKDLEDHEAMCGARTTKCSLCGKTLLIKNLKDHLEKLHKIKMENYQQKMNSGDFYGIKTNNDSSTKFGNPDNLGLKKMTSDEEIAYALALSQEEEQQRKKKQQNNNNYNNKNSNFMEKNSSLNMYKKKSSKIDYDELEYEYEKQLFEDEMNNYMEEDEKEEKK